jgi:DNA-binding response OmpR family regulator
MATSVDNAKLPATPWGLLPPRMRVLFITGAGRTGGWLAEAFAADSASEVLLDEILGVQNGLARLRDELYDAVLVSHGSDDLDALDLLDAIRAGSSDEQPIVILGDQSEQEMSTYCYEAGGDAYVCVDTTTTRSLIWIVARAMERNQLIADNRRLQQEQRNRLKREHEEAERLLAQQRAMVADLERICQSGLDGPKGREPDLPQSLLDHYRELLRAYVIMGSGNLSEEMNRLADLLAWAHLSAQQAMQLHLFVLEELVRGLGSRSARHVMNRADMLILEVMIHLADRYRTRYMEGMHPPRQLLLAGFE